MRLCTLALLGALLGAPMSARADVRATVASDGDDVFLVHDGERFRIADPDRAVELRRFGEHEVRIEGRLVDGAAQVDALLSPAAPRELEGVKVTGPDGRAWLELGGRRVRTSGGGSFVLAAAEDGAQVRARAWEYDDGALHVEAVQATVRSRSSLKRTFYLLLAPLDYYVGSVRPGQTVWVEAQTGRRRAWVDPPRGLSGHMPLDALQLGEAPARRGLADGLRPR
jgi:hypothetical protein